MMLKEFFHHDINRAIETVIKADDREHVNDEVSEYVITQEISKKIAGFFEAYNNYQGVNGVWISGFFGSGKSHLLKIISYVLENKKFDGKEAGRVFASKIGNDEILKGHVLTAAKIPSESVLFNIDQQAMITSKDDPNAVLSVFYKVFYDHLGFYGYRQHVAEFEMWLAKEGKYDAFKTKFAALHGKDWEVARVDYIDPILEDNLAEVCGELFGMDASKYDGILDKFEDGEKRSIEDFCEKVNDYVKTKPTGFRLNFFVDEIGQFISDNTKLMLNLQTIAETLATRTKGRSWILVTSQEELKSVIGDFTKKQENDFSRIQARFALKIPLTSANVDEVIEKRLLEKKQSVGGELKGFWKKEQAHLSTLLTFSEAGLQFKGYKGEKDFVNKFPFVPYQFDLFQACRRALSTHNAFQGRHSSVGERSMLGVFQQVLKGIENQGLETLVSFDKMFEGIRSELKGDIQKSIIMAERNLTNDFALKVLKTLFMVKYYANFKTTKRNISVMMIDDIRVDLKKHEEAVSVALNTLENQSYIQRNNDLYEFLTDAEKDIEQEIKEVETKEGAEIELLKNLIFDEIIGDNKVRFLDNKQDYNFSNKIDGTLLGRERELTIEIITPLFPDHDKPAILQSDTMGTAVMRMVLPLEMGFIKDVKMYLRTDKYVRLNQSTSNQPERRRILHDKTDQNRLRKKGLIDHAKKLLAESDVYMNGSKHEMTASADGKTKVMRAFQNLIRNVYRNLNMLGGVVYSEDSIRNTLRSKDEVLFAEDNATMSGAEKEIISQITRRKNQSDRTSLADLRAYFERKPYGWYPNAIWTNIVQLYKRGQIELRQNSNLLDDDGVLDAVLYSNNHQSTMLELVMADNPTEVKKLRKCFSDLFNVTPTGTVGKDVANEFKKNLKELSVEIDQMLFNKSDFPFLEILSPFGEKVQKLAQKDYGYFLTNRADFEDDLLDFKEDHLDPIRRFWNGEQRNIYQKIGSFLQKNNSNLDDIEDEELELLKKAYENPKPYVGNLIKEAKAAKDALAKKVLAQINKERKVALAKIEKLKAEVEANPDFISLEGSQQAELTMPFTREIERLNTQRFIANIQQSATRVENQLLPDTLNRMHRMLQPAEMPGVSEPEIKYIPARKVAVNFEKTRLESDADVDAYVEALRAAYKNQIQNHKRIVI